MRAMVLEEPAPIARAPLRATDLPKPEPAAGEALVRVEACGICRTDLHVVEGELPPVKKPVVPGHQVVGIVEGVGPGESCLRPGTRVGVAWLRSTCGECSYCRRGSENLCAGARFTGYHEDGGFAQYCVVRQDFTYSIPPGLEPVEVAPLLCAGIIGFRALRRAGTRPGCRLGLYGFGASAHIAIQVALHWGCAVYVMSREERHRGLASRLGAAWVGGSYDRPPEPLDAAIIFAPAGELVLPALEALDRGGTLAIAGIYMTDLPSLSYARHLFYEKRLVSVTANTRKDGEDFLAVAQKIPIRPATTKFPLEQANHALLALKSDRISGAGVLVI